ncbi:MAG TPA: hypothetical protein DCQ94_07410 [Nitrospira sp.]|nr:hypothetical protein [Nitrospira sp.]
MFLVQYGKVVFTESRFHHRCHEAAVTREFPMADGLAQQCERDQSPRRKALPSSTNFIGESTWLGSREGSLFPDTTI